MNLEQLFARVDRLAFPARQRELAAVARALAGTGELGALLSELDSQPGIPRRWAVLLAIVAGDADQLGRYLTAPDPAVALVAVAQCVRRGLHAEAIAAALPSASTAWRQAVYRALRAGNAAEFATMLLPVVRQRFGDHEAAVVLPACTADTVAELLPELDFAVPNLAALARRHPGLVLDHLRRRLDEAGESRRAAVWNRFASALSVLAGHDPGRIIELLERMGPPTGLPAGSDRWLAGLARTDVERVVAILADPDRHIRFRCGRVLTRALSAAADASLARLARSMLTDGARLTALLHGLPPARRPAVLEGALGERDLLAAGLPVTVLDELPWRSRHVHARGLLATARVADQPRLRWEVTARLPWSEAEPVLRDQTARPATADRALAYPLLINAAAATRDPDLIGTLLAALTRLSNEQDPVRGEALRALAAQPGWLFGPAVLPELERIATDAVQARDASWGTRQAVTNLALLLVRQGIVARQPELVEGGLRIVEVSGSHVRALNLRGLDRELPRGAEHAVFAALRPRIEADVAVGRQDLLLSLASGLRRRAWAMPELQDLLGRAVTAKDDTTVRRAIDLWLAPPATRDERVETVLRRDPSTITVPAVANTISRRRTDLLDRVLDGPLDGRFVKRGVRLVPIFTGTLREWLPRQVERYAGLLAELAGARDKPAWERAAPVRRLGRLPGAGAELVRPFLADPEVVVVEAALAVLAWTDRPDRVIGELLGYADTDRARVAVYAASRCARSIAPAELLAALRPVLAGSKITARKEAIRLLAQHRLPAAAGELAALWANPQLHRDLRRAIVSAARLLLDDPRMWTVLAEAVTHPAVATALTEAGPDSIAERHRARYGALVRSVAASEDPDSALLGLAAWPAWSAWDRDGGTVMATTVSQLDNTATWRRALDALLATADREALRMVVSNLLAATEVTVADRDQPAGQRIRELATRLGNRLRDSGESLRETAREVSALLAAEPDFRADALSLAVAALPRRGSLLPELREIAGLADRPVLAWQVANRLGKWLAGGDLGRVTLLADASALVADGGAGALLAVVIAGRAGAFAGWRGEWRRLVGELRGHADLDVRDRARRIVVVAE